MRHAADRSAFDRRDDGDDKPREECGVFAISGADNAAVLIALGLHELQHRGQEGCGIAVFDGEHFQIERHMGLVGDHFAPAGVERRFKGRVGIGHTRYATQGKAVLRNVQPLFVDLADQGFAIAHNGNLTNARRIRSELVQAGSLFQSTSDTEVIPQLMARSPAASIVDRFIEALRRIEGGYALAAMHGGLLLAARDPMGLRPLVLGRMANGAVVIASESCAFNMVGATYEREVENGEVLVIVAGEPGAAPQVQSLRAFPPQPARPCVFEFVYFARAHSIVNGRSVSQVRHRFGQLLARDAPVEADIVVPVMDSGLPAAMGFSAASGIPMALGLVRSTVAQRTFIEPEKSIRQFKVRLKHAANESELKGKRVVLVDDSIVRGTTSKEIVAMVREAKAAEVHFRVASPPIKYPDFYGIDMPTQEELIAHNRSLEEIAEELGVKTIAFLTIDRLYEGLGERDRRSDYPQFADHCFTGDYPIPPVDFADNRADKDIQLSFLSDGD